MAVNLPDVFKEALDMKSILIVEDEEAIARVLSAYLKKPAST